MVVVLPAPFGPRRPNTSPWRTCRSSLSTAVNSPYFLVRPRVLIAGAVPAAFGTSGSATAIALEDEEQAGRDDDQDADTDEQADG